MKNLLLLWIAIMATTSLTAQNIEVERVQKTLMTKKTASWCSPCGTWGWDVFEELVEANLENTVVIAAHYSTSNDALTTPTGTQIVDNMESTFGRPAFFVNTLNVANSRTDAREKINTAIDEALAQSPVAQTGMNVTFTEDTRTLTVNTKTQFFEDAEGEYSLGVYLVQKSIIGFQQSRSDEANHKEVLRDAITADIFGAPIANGTIAAASTFEHTIEVVISEEEDIDNYEVMTVIWKKQAENYGFVNVNLTDEIGEAVVNSIDESTLDAGFQINPTYITSTAGIDLILTEAGHADIALYNTNGQKVQNIYQGRLGSGYQTISFEKDSQLTRGVYFVRVLLNGQQWSRQVVLK